MMKSLKNNALWLISLLYLISTESGILAAEQYKSNENGNGTLSLIQVQVGEVLFTLPPRIANLVNRAKQSFQELEDKVQMFGTTIELRNFDTSKCQGAWWGYGINPRLFFSQIPSEFWNNLIHDDSGNQYFDYEEVYNYWKNPNNVQHGLGDGTISADLILAQKNGHLDGHRQQEEWPAAQLEPFLPPQPTETTLVLGCFHNSSCSNHSGGIKKGSHYTVDEIGNPNIKSKFQNKVLWDVLRRFQFDEVILEGAGQLADRQLMESIFSVLRPGGTFKTLHFHPSNINDPFLYTCWNRVVGEPLVDMTKDTFLMDIGFVNVGLYTPSAQEELEEEHRGVKQLKAEKPY
jgi:hypothetical protein